MAQIILASASPRRSELLRQAGLTFSVIPSQGEEVITSTHPAEVVEELSLQKAQEVADRILKGDADILSGNSGPVVVIGADTVVAADHRILGKPADDRHAAGTRPPGLYRRHADRKRRKRKHPHAYFP